MTIVDEFRQDDQRVLDRLVDGELGVHQRRELLAVLDDEPGGWRRLALAFLEAQSWRWQLVRAAGEPVLQGADAERNVPHQPAAQRIGRLGGALAVAAGLLLAFLLGTRVAGPLATKLPPSSQMTEPQITEPQLTETQTPPSRDAQRAELPAPSERPHVADNASEPPAAPWETITLTPLDGTDQPIRLRVAKDETGPPALAGVPAALSTLLSRSLEHEGWQVDRRQELIPFELSDGRRIEVPVEEINLQRPQGVQF